MPTERTNDVLDEIERGCEGVTPGPWEVGIAGDYGADSPHGADFTPIHSDTWGAFVSVVTNTDNGGGRIGTNAQGQANLAHIARLDPATVLELVRLARLGQLPPGTATGCFDKDGQPLCLGDRVRYNLAGGHTKREYWNPEYEIVWAAPRFTLKHVGGGEDGDNHDFILKHGGGNGMLELLARAVPVPLSKGGDINA